MSDDTFVLYETLDDGQIVRIMLNRPEARNAQNRGMLAVRPAHRQRGQGPGAGRRVAPGLSLPP